MLGNKYFINSFRREIRSVTRCLPKLIISMICSALLIIISWICFGGPCKAVVFFVIPGGGFTVVLYFVLWFIMFTLFGGETALICTFGSRTDKRHLLYHIAAHLCLFLWYPLFFIGFSHFLALLLLISGLVLLILDLKESVFCSILMTTAIIIKMLIVFAFIYINIAFLIIN